MRDSYVYFNKIGHPITVAEFAFMYNVSAATALRAIDGTHPSYLCEPQPNIAKVKRPVGRPRKVTEVANKPATHCRNGHELIGNNVYSYTKPNKRVILRCRTCQTNNMKNYYRRNAR